MINVLLNVRNTKMWVGGLNYFVNLCQALYGLPERKIELVILNGGPGLPAPLSARRSLRWPRRNVILNELCKRVLHRDIFAQHLLRQGIRLFSHGDFSRFSPVPALCWIPDFQQKHLPRFFKRQEIEKLHRQQSMLAAHARFLVFSSQTARDDFKLFYPESRGTAYILRFVASPRTEALPAAGDVLHAHGISRPFFHVPNQLWAHKNHSVVVDALKILKSRGRRPLIISTGHTEDYRNPGFFAELQSKVRAAGCEDDFRFLGLIDFGHVVQLMRQSVALINPSLFEGWSTTVEEGKSLGKRMLLSDITVHREQAPERGAFFAPDDPEALADLMQQALDEHDPAAEAACMEKASRALPERLRQFGREYQDIVLDVLHRAGESHA